MRKLIEKLKKKKEWNIELNEPIEISRKSNSLVLWIIFVFASLYFVLALFGIGLILGIQLILENFYQNIVLNNIFWVIYGLIFGLSFSFFAQGIPSRRDKETPLEILQSFYHYFTYFLAFFTVITLWVCIAFFLIEIFLI